MNTEYKIAMTPGELNKLIPWMSERVDELAIKEPIAYAEREGVIVGALGTVATDKAVVAGPLIVDVGEGKTRGFVAIGLVEAYEALLRKIGLARYEFFIDENTSGFGSMPAKVGYKVWAVDGDRTWYTKELS